ncbi:cytochrome d ubiquinol oxidase subunit II [Aquimonas sp.]|jgi:cytochrome d ubiquinol oxidase subunit II|uniref:cytochrome d ubiquinol oxidase subunit II n=1 Tax=Aquimonas sp. TaxID=1872588 RepID=UPI0037C08CDC
MSAWLPEIFMALMGLAMLAYVVLDGFDLGVGILLPGADDAQKDTMIASIGPFWDANETWLVLGVGILLIAFPMAHGMILSALYLPVTLMLIALILRGVAFDFRVKARAKHKHLWDRAFFIGSALAALSQGFMLGAYILGFDWSVANFAFASFIGVCLLAGYALLGSTWLLMKAEGELQMKAVRWAQRALWLTGIGIGAVSVATPMVSARIFEKWFSLPNFILLLQIPLITAVLFFIALRALKRMRAGELRSPWQPFACSVGLFVFAFLGLAYSLFPYLVVDRITIHQAAAAPGSLMIILFGVAITLPAILAYSAYSYRVFWGKATQLRYY